MSRNLKHPRRAKVGVFTSTAAAWHHTNWTQVTCMYPVYKSCACMCTVTLFVPRALLWLVCGDRYVGEEESGRTVWCINVAGRGWQSQHNCGTSVLPNMQIIKTWRQPHCSFYSLCFCSGEETMQLRRTLLRSVYCVLAGTVSTCMSRVYATAPFQIMLRIIFLSKFNFAMFN
jgi:hypothetical protein